MSSRARILFPEMDVRKSPRRVLEKLHPLSLDSDSAPDDAMDSSSVSENSSESLTSSSYNCEAESSVSFLFIVRFCPQPYSNVSFALFTQLRFFLISGDLCRASNSQINCFSLSTTGLTIFERSSSMISFFESFESSHFVIFLPPFFLSAASAFSFFMRVLRGPVRIFLTCERSSTSCCSSSNLSCAFPSAELSSSFES